MKEKNRKVRTKRKNFSLPNLSGYPRLSMFLRLLFGAALLSICVVLSYRYWTRTIGDGAYKYSDETYNHIEEVVATCAIPEVGLDRLPLQEELTKFVDTFENNITELFCLKQDGYFKAEVTVEMDEKCNITGSSRNYNSLQEYMDHYWLDLGLRVLGSALGLFIVLTGSILGITSICVFISKKIKSKKLETNSSSLEKDSSPAIKAIESA